MKLRNKLSFKEISSKSENYWSYFLAITLFFFILATLLTFTIYNFAIKNSSNDLALYVNSLKNRLNGFPLKNNGTNIERNIREIKNLKTKKLGNNYYEEQRAVLVNADSSPPFFKLSDDLQESENDYANSENLEQYSEYYDAPPDSYYGSWKYVTPSSIKISDRMDKKILTGIRDNRNEYENYPSKTLQPPASNLIKNAVGEDIIVSILKSLIHVWNIYEALANAWNTMYEHRKPFQPQNRKQENHDISIKSKNATHIEYSKYSNNTKSDVSKTALASLDSSKPSNDTISALRKGKTRTKNELQKDNKLLSTKKTETLLSKRSADFNDTSEGRYIKGDPLKGYYDFVITEGSYKFWAVFQVGTAILIIYSTFAAIYYSKVNPLVGDYDYTDYLGGGRSLLSGDLDFIDDDSLTVKQLNSSASWNSWMPQTDHSIKFILDAIDKLPVDHKVNSSFFSKNI